MKGLRTSEIVNVLGRDRYMPDSFFVGPCDLLTKAELDCVVFVVNTARSHHKGKHWVGIFKNANAEGGHYEFFDPCGRNAREYDSCFTNFLNNNKSGHVCNQTQFQTTDIPCCGHYVLYFILSRCRTRDVMLPHDNAYVYNAISSLI